MGGGFRGGRKRINDNQFPIVVSAEEGTAGESIDLDARDANIPLITLYVFDLFIS